jgi:hypothetical protein
MSSPASFGRRGPVARPSPIHGNSSPGSGSESPTPAAGTRGPNQNVLSLRFVLTVVLGTSVIMGLTLGVVKLANSPQGMCNSKPPSQRGLLEIDWCQAAAAAVQGAARGVAGGAGARR